MEGKNEKQIQGWGGVLATALLLAVLFLFAACSNNSSSGSGGISGSDGSTANVDHSLGEISERLKIPETDSSGNKNFSVEEDNKEGIYINYFAIPQNANSYRVYIDGIGQVTENYFGVGKLTRGEFLYPFLEPNKEYTVRVVFQKEEKIDSQDYTLNTPDYEIGYFDITIKAGAKSKGEVFLEDFGKIQVAKTGDFTFTKKTAFHNESLLEKKWYVEIGLNEGVSWMHPNRRNKWLTQIQIPCTSLGETYNFYTYPRPWGDVTKVDFIAYRPIMYYEYEEKQYKYQWDGYVLDTNCKPESELWTDIDITKNMAKLKGTWEYKAEYDIDSLNGHSFPAHFAYIHALEIDANTVYVYKSHAYTKIGGKFTEDDLSLLNGLELNGLELNRLELSNDGRTLSIKYEDYNLPLSEYFKEDISHEHEFNGDSLNCDIRYKLQVFYAEKALRIYEVHDGGKEKEGWYYYKKQ